ncbi:MAG: FAD-dependent oxidoreductase, partial [Alistipes sp.]|jgi:heterodisulfide reductase subunit A|nr:FAD-dependent oxidoreductase [Alistipes sp.]
MFPAADVFNFYMDIRMFGPGYEEMYREAQIKHNIHFVRGRISEVSPTFDNRLQIKAEDTLTGRPLKLGVDMLVLLIGMKANAHNSVLTAESNLTSQPSGFMQPKDSFLHNVESNVDGVFYAGAVTAPKNVGESINEGTAAARAVVEWLEKR